MNSYIRILPALFIIANISCYSSEGSMNDSNIIKYQVNIEQYIEGLHKNIKDAIIKNIINDQFLQDKVFNKYEALPKKLLEQCSKVYDEQCNALYKRFKETKDIKYIDDVLIVYSQVIRIIPMYISNYIKNNNEITNALETYCESIKQYTSFCVEKRLYPLFRQKINEYKCNINHSFDTNRLEFFYKEQENNIVQKPTNAVSNTDSNQVSFPYNRVLALKGLTNKVSRTINNIKTQYSKTFGKVYIGGFRDITKNIIGLLNQFNAQLNSIDQNNYINTVTELHSILKQLNKANGNYNTRYSEKQRAIRNNTIKKGINKLIYNIDGVRQFGQLIYNCSTNLAKSFYSILNGGQIMSLALG